MENNQVKPKWGGVRPNSGRKPGVSSVTTLKRKIQDYVDESTVDNLVKLALTQAMTQPLMLKFLLEQLFGKAPQTINADIGGELILTIAKQVADKHGTPLDTGDSS